MTFCVIPGGDAAPFSESLPDFHRISGGLLLLQKQVHLVDVVTGGLVGGTVDGNSVPYLILYHKHTDLFQLLAQLLNVIADNAVVDVHIALVVEHIEGAGGIDFKGRGDILGLPFPPVNGAGYMGPPVWAYSPGAGHSG